MELNQNENDTIRRDNKLHASMSNNLGLDLMQGELKTRLSKHICSKKVFCLSFMFSENARTKNIKERTEKKIQKLFSS